MPNLFLDIETLPTARDDVRNYIAATVSPPGNMSKPETIAKWETESKPEAVQEAVDKTSFDGAFGRVCVIGWAIDGGEVRAIFDESSEGELLATFAAYMDSSELKRKLFDTAIVGHNVAAFDLRFLAQRYVVHGIKPPAVIARAAQAKPWEIDKVFDTSLQWAGVGNRVKLDKLCLALGIPSPKDDMDGSQVAAYVAAGRIKEVAAYCRKDVAAVRDVWRRMTFAEAA